MEQYFLDYGVASAEIEVRGVEGDDRLQIRCLCNSERSKNMQGRVVNTFMPSDFFGEVAFVATAASLLEGESSGKGSDFWYVYMCPRGMAWYH